MKKVLKNKNLILGIVIMALVASFTLGYAFLNTSLGIQGVANLLKIGKVKITSVVLDTSASGNTLQNYGTMAVDEDGVISLNYSFNVSREEQTYQATYLVYIENTGSVDHTFTGLVLNPEINITSGNSSNSGATVYPPTIATSNSHHNINIGDTIYGNETRCMAIVLSIYVASRGNATITVGGGGEVGASVENNGELTGTLVTNSVDLRGAGTIDCFDVEVINTYNYARSFNLTAGNTNFVLVDSSGNSLPSFNIGAPDENDSTANDQTYNVCIKENTGAVFLTTSSTSPIVISSSGIENTSIGDLAITVDITEERDNEIPHIGEVTITPGVYDTTNNILPVHIGFKRLDDGGSDIDNYYVRLYDATTGSFVQEYPTNKIVEGYTIDMDSTFLTSNLDDMVTNNHSYYVKVYGKDKAGNIGSSYCSLNDNNEYCVASDSTSLKWKFTVDDSDMTNMHISSSKVAYLNTYYTATFQADSNYNLPSSIVVYMPDEDHELTARDDYTYASANQTNHLTLNIPVSGDIIVNGAASYSGGGCLIAGTKIRLADGTSKKIEDVQYDDLIMAYSYDLGKIVYEYPIWIEREWYTDEYQRTYFSNGEYLDTVSTHGVYSVDANKYVSVLDKDNFHVGTKVIAINSNGEKEVVEVTSIETKYENVKYYHVSSTRYHNVIANNLLTTDAILIVSNMFPFDKDIKWTKERDDFIANNELFHYEDWSWLFPNHIFKGFRMAEAKILYYQGILDVNAFYDVLVGEIHPVPTSENGINIWKITTSDEYENGVVSPWYEEGTYYTLPEPTTKEGKKFVGWYNTADNKYYMPGDQIVIDYGMYFEAIWE